MLSYIAYTVIQTNRQISQDAVKKQNKKTKNVVWYNMLFFFYIKIYFILFICTYWQYTSSEKTLFL